MSSAPSELTQLLALTECDSVLDLLEKKMIALTPQLNSAGQLDFWIATDCAAPANADEEPAKGRKPTLRGKGLTVTEALTHLLRYRRETLVIE